MTGQHLKILPGPSLCSTWDSGTGDQLVEAGVVSTFAGIKGWGPQGPNFLEVMRSCQNTAWGGDYLLMTVALAVSCLFTDLTALANM